MINWQRLTRLLSLLTLSISPILVGFSEISPIAENSIPSNAISLEFPPSGNRGAPKNTTGGASRSEDNNCLVMQEGELPLVAMMPNRENIGKTATATPSLYWYVPQTTATTGEFVLLDESDTEVYYTSFALPQQSGIVKLTVPAKANLKPGKYSWAFMVICDSQYRNRDKYVKGTLEYTELNSTLKNQLKTASPLQKAQLYADSNIWYETFDTISQLQTENQQEWQTLLESVGLGQLVDKPLVGCCIAKN